MSKKKMSMDEQVALLMQGSEYGDDELKKVMGIELRDRLIEAEKAGRPLRVYCGYDPTHSDLLSGAYSYDAQIASISRAWSPGDICDRLLYRTRGRSFGQG